MPVSVTIASMQAMFPATPKEILISYVPHINVLCNKYGIDNSIRLCAFLAQVAHESQGLTRTSENLNYSKEGLLKIFKKYFNEVSAEEYAHKPQKIANRVYANRMGNSGEESEDGWKFRGKGLIQLTGKHTIVAFAKWCGKSLDATLAYLETPEGAVASAVYFWHKNDLNKYADKEDIVGLTKRINGGTHGLKERGILYNKAKEIFK